MGNLFSRLFSSSPEKTQSSRAVSGMRNRASSVDAATLMDRVGSREDRAE